MESDPDPDRQNDTDSDPKNCNSREVVFVVVTLKNLHLENNINIAVWFSLFLQKRNINENNMGCTSILCKIFLHKWKKKYLNYQL
jgi:hypothetical protein